MTSKSNQTRSAQKSGVSVSTHANHRKKSLGKNAVLEGTEVELSNPVAIVDMLDVQSIDIQLKAMYNLLKFLRAYPFYLHRLIERGIVDKTKELVRHSNQDIVIYALDLMGQLSMYDHVKDMIVADETFVTDVVMMIQDPVKQTSSGLSRLEQCLNCISKWCEHVHVCRILKENADFSMLLIHLSLPDPDIQAYLLEIILKLIEDLFLAEMVVNLDVFKFTGLFDLLLSEYPHVQHLSMRLIQKFLSFSNENIRVKFLEEDGIKRMMGIIEIHSWIDLHDKAFQVIKSTANSLDVAERIGEVGLKSLLQYLEQAEFRHLEQIAFETVVEFLKDNPSRRMLMSLNIIDILFHFFNEGTKDMVQLAITGFGLMTLEEKGIEQMEVFPGLILELFNIMTNSNETWPIRSSAACSMQMMLIRGVIFPRAFMHSRRWNTLVEYLESFPTKVPLEMAMPVAGCIYNLLLNQENHRVPCENLMTALSKCLKETLPGCDQLKGIILDILSTISCSNLACTCLSNPIDCRTLIYYIFDVANQPELLKSVCQLFINLNKRVLKFADRIIETGTLTWLLKLQEEPTAIPEISLLITSVYQECPFVKFHCCNRLEITELINSGFFYSRGLKVESKKLKSLEQIIENKKNLSRPVFLVYFEKPVLSSDSSNSKEKSSFNTSKTDTLSQRLSITDAEILLKAELSSLTDGTVKEILHAETIDDPWLRLHLRKVKKLLGCQPNNNIEMNYQIILDPSSYKDKIKNLATYVCQALTIQDEESNINFESHITELKTELGSFLIPMGFLKLGTKLEKAVMFKALGDMVGVPSAIAKTSHAIGWVEVCIQPDDELINAKSVYLDCKLITTTHLVDLAEKPGTLYPLTSLEANEYINSYTVPPKCRSKTSRPAGRIHKCSS